VNNTGTKKR